MSSMIAPRSQDASAVGTQRTDPSGPVTVPSSFSTCAKPGIVPSGLNATDNAVVEIKSFLIPFLILVGQGSLDDSLGVAPCPDSRINAAFRLICDITRLPADNLRGCPPSRSCRRCGSVRANATELKPRARPVLWSGPCVKHRGLWPEPSSQPPARTGRI